MYIKFIPRIRGPVINIKVGIENQGSIYYIQGFPVPSHMGPGLFDY